MARQRKFWQAILPGYWSDRNSFDVAVGRHFLAMGWPYSRTVRMQLFNLTKWVRKTRHQELIKAWRQTTKVAKYIATFGKGLKPSRLAVRICFDGTCRVGYLMKLKLKAGRPGYAVQPDPVL
jgi:hypothetical protein